MNQNTIDISINNKTVKVLKNITIKDLIDLHSDLVGDDMIALMVNGEYAFYDQHISKSVNIESIIMNSMSGYKLCQAGLKFVLEVAIKNVFGNKAEVHYRHSIGDGIYTTVSNCELKKDDLDKVKKEMDSIISKNEEILRVNVNAKEGISYFDSVGEYEKANNVQNTNISIITLYKLEKYFNYFYSYMPYRTGCMTKYDVVFLKDNEIALVMPDNPVFNSVDYNNYDRVIDTYKLNKKTLEDYGMPYICDINKRISDGNSKDLVLLFETFLHIQVASLINKIVKLDKRFLFVAGPSSSGKTTTAKKLSICLQSMGYAPILISTDDYFVNKEDSPRLENGDYDFESIECVDIKKLNDDLNDLLNGKEITLPKYNFQKGIREDSDKKIKLSDNTFIIIEGIHCLNDKLVPGIDDNHIFRIYLSPFISVEMDRHNYLSSTDLRLIRRIVRDNNNRNVKVTETLSQWMNVRTAEEKNIFSFINKADVILNTSLPYELGVLKVYVEPLLYSVSKECKESSEAVRLINFLSNIYPISSEYVPKDSIIREFIGDSIFKERGDI